MQFKFYDIFIVSLLIVLVESNEYDVRNIKSFVCPPAESTTCSCSFVYGDFELNCPYANPSIILRINPNRRIQIDCATQNDHNFNLLPRMDIGDIPTVQIARCPLPKGQPIVPILDRLGIKKIRGFFFSSYGHANLGVSLVRQHLSGLNDLERLYLSGNGLTELPDDLFDDVSSIKWLDLQRNKVHLPRDIFKNLNKLEYLELGYNNLKSFEPGVFRNQNKLRLLNLWGNDLRNLTKDAFEGLTSLNELDLSASNIELFQSDVLYHVKNLSNLNLSSNKITTLPVEIFSHCTNLERLRLINNRVQLKSLPDGLFQNNAKLADLSISGDMAEISPGIFTGATNLFNLSLTRNELETLPKGLFADQGNLYQLDLSKNKLVELNDVFENTPNLVKLILSENQLTNISGKTFENLKKLRELLIDNNNLYRIHQNAFINTGALEYIDLENNFLSFMEIDTMMDSFDLGSPFQYLNELKILNLRNNTVNIIFRDWAVTALQLQKLDLSYNNISSITMNDLQFLQSNTIVNLTNNNISEIDLRGLESLGFANEEQPATDVKIYIENNPIHCDCLVLHLVKYLQNDIHSSVYKVVNIIPGTLSCSSPENLQGRDVSTLKLDELLCPLDAPGSSEKRCPQNCDCMVRVSDQSLIINCANMNLTKVPNLPSISTYQLQSIELHIENNSISELPSTNTPGYSDVRKLFARNNQLTRVDSNNLPNNLTILDISNNRLAQFNETAILQLNTTKSLRALSLAGNEWNCDCESLPFLLFAQNQFKIIADYQNLKCENGELLAEMGPSDFCPEDHTALIASSVMLGIVGIVIGVLLALYYKYNQEIKVWLFAHNLCLWFVTEEELDKEKKYDAFISYSHKDEEFITEHLVPNLESGPNPFKLCLHIRDWIVGEWIPSQIAKSVEDSRRTIVVLSPNFLESVWGRMEFRTAHKNALNEGRARVIVIIYGEIGNISGLEPELKAYLNMNTYVKWGDPWFWDKLRYAMPHPQHVKLHSKRGLIKNGLKSSVDDKLELIMPSPSTPPLTTPPAEIAENNHIAAKLNGSINHLDKSNGQGMNGYGNGAFIINTNSKQSDV